MLVVSAKQERGVDDSGEDVREFFVAADSRPPACVAAVERVVDERVGSEVEQCDDGFALPCLGGEVDRGDALAVGRAAERAALVRVGAELDERAHGGDAAVDRGPGQRGAAVGVGVGLGRLARQGGRSLRRGRTSPPRRALRRAPPAGSSEGCQAGKPPWGR